MKKLLSMVMVMSLLFSARVKGDEVENELGLNGQGIYSEQEYLEVADELNNLELIKGSDKGYELDREANRIEGLIMLIRLIGKGLTNGLSDLEFGSKQSMTGQQFITFVLRSLGYDDQEGDFVWNKSIDKAGEVGLLSPYETEAYSSGDKQFLRGDCAKVSYSALSSTIKDSTKTLGQQLIDQGAIDESKYVVSEEEEISLVREGSVTYIPLIQRDGNLFIDYESIMTAYPEVKYYTSRDIFLIDEDLNTLMKEAYRDFLIEDENNYKIQYGNKGLYIGETSKRNNIMNNVVLYDENLNIIASYTADTIDFTLDTLLAFDTNMSFDSNTYKESIYKRVEEARKNEVTFPAQAAIQYGT